MQEAGHESLNVVVDFQNDKLRTNNQNITSDHTLLGAEKVTEINETQIQSKEQTTPRNEASEGEADLGSNQGGYEVLGGSQKME